MHILKNKKGVAAYCGSSEISMPRQSKELHLQQIDSSLISIWVANVELLAST